MKKLLAAVLVVGALFLCGTFGLSALRFVQLFTSPLWPGDPALVSGSIPVNRGDWQDLTGSYMAYTVPAGIALAPDGTVYVSDRKNRRVVKLSSSLGFVAGWDAGRGPGEQSPGKSDPAGLAADAEGNVYVADRENNRVVKYSGEGVPLASLAALPQRSWRQENYDGFVGTRDVAVDGSGNLYVADTSYSRVLKFSPSGESLARQGGWRVEHQDFPPRNGLLASEPDGNLLVLSGDSIRRLAPEGSLLGSFRVQVDSLRDSGGKPSPPLAIAAGPQGRLYAWVDRHIVELASDGKVLRTLPLPVGRKSDDVDGLAVDSAGNLYVATPLDNRVWKFGPEGRLLAQWGQPMEFRDLGDVALDLEGHLLVAEVNAIEGGSSAGERRPTGRNRINRIDTDGRLLERWDLGDVTPTSLAVDGVGRVYVADRPLNRVVVLSPRGERIAAWGSTGRGPGQFREPSSIALDPGGSVYVADKGNHRVQKFARDGRFLVQWGSRGSGPGQFRYPPIGVAVGPDGSVLVIEQGDIRDKDIPRLQRFDPNGRFLDSRPTAPPSYLRDFIAFGASGVAVDARGRIYLSQNDLISQNEYGLLRLGTDLQPLERWAPRNRSGGPSGGVERRVAVAPDGELYVVLGVMPREGDVFYGGERRLFRLPPPTGP